MITISLCMIVKNEEAVLGRCLTSCGNVFDEIIVVDTGSTDATKAIAARFTEKVYDFPWDDDFSHARNYSFSQATSNYIMWMDADDVLLPADLYKLRMLKRALPYSVDAVMMKYNVGFDQDGSVTMSYYRERIVKRLAGFAWKDPVHEYIQVYGNIKNADISVTHKKESSADPGRNLAIYRKMAERGMEFSPRNILYYARELRGNGFIRESVAQYERFLNTGEGWVEDVISACFELSCCCEQLQDPDGMLRAALESFAYAAPRAENCCKIGDYFLTQKDYANAVYWFRTAMNLARQRGWGFVLEDYHGYIPALQLCVCYYQLGDVGRSVEYNRIAKGIKPNDPSVISNEQFFASLKKKTK